MDIERSFIEIEESLVVWKRIWCTLFFISINIFWLMAEEFVNIMLLLQHK